MVSLEFQTLINHVLEPFSTSAPEKHLHGAALHGNNYKDEANKIQRKRYFV